MEALNSYCLAGVRQRQQISTDLDLQEFKGGGGKQSLQRTSRNSMVEAENADLVRQEI